MTGTVRQNLSRMPRRSAVVDNDTAFLDLMVDLLPQEG